MSRRRAAEKTTILPDHKFKDLILAKFMNRIMKDGKKSVSEKIVYGAFDIVSKKTDKSPIEYFHDALNNVKPSLEVRSRRVGGANYQVPTEVRPASRLALAMRWIGTGARQRSGRGMSEKLSAELLEASRGQGAAVRRKEEVFRMAEANRAFAHYRW